jgi:Fe-Mn family superoxide dismutase
MDARLQELSFDPATLNRLSPALINSHHQDNLGGAVKRLNAIRAQLSSTAFATAPGFQLNGLNARYLSGGLDGWQAAKRPLVDKSGNPTP